MKKNINLFNMLDYVDVIKFHINSNENQVYGYKAKLAQAAACQRSYLSQVLAGQTHFTLEHSIRVCKFWNYRKVDTDYFINLVEYNRAGSQELKEYFYAKLILIRDEQENLSKRIQDKEILPQEKAAIFYSNWQYMAIMILITIPSFRTTVAISQRLSLKEEIVVRVLEQLSELGLVVKNGVDWLACKNTIHVPRNSPFNSLNHANWRNIAVQNAFLSKTEDVHYTSVCSISKSDVNQIKDLVFKLIDKSREIIGPSAEEEIYCLTCDWFKV
jgi:uncharacterized protein (TIGR02147 family)